MHAHLPKSGIYMIRNVKSGKYYIGSAIDLARRLKDHRRMLRGGYHHSKHLQAAWNLDGEENFSMSPISLIADVGRLIELEQFAIDQYRSADSRYGYNMRARADSNLGHKFSEETKRKNSIAQTGRKHTKQTKDLMRAAHIGVKKSADHARNISIGKTGLSRPDVSRWAPERLSRFDKVTVLLIRSEQKAGLSLKQISKKYGCSVATASYVVRGIGAYYSTI